MNCLYINLFFNIVAGIVQIFINSWSQLLYPRVTKVCQQPFELRHDFFLHLIIVVETSGNRWARGPDCTTNGTIYPTFTFCVEKSYDETHLPFDGTFDQRCYFKHVSLKQSQFYHCQMSTAHR